MIVVSFHTPEPYYQAAGDRLRADCLRLGLAHDIQAWTLPPGATWIEACRHKVVFMHQMLERHDRPILWLDADSRLAQRPAVLEGAACDFAAFLRGFRYLREMDPLALPRFFSPFALYFNTTPAARAFLAEMRDREAACTESATDDYFLQEAWVHHRHRLSVMLLSPDLVGPDWPPRPGQVFQVGLSGHVSEHKGRARQHEPVLATPARRKAALVQEAAQSQATGDWAEAAALLRIALRVGGPDDALAHKAARLLQRGGTGEAATAFLAGYVGEQPGDAHVLRHRAAVALDSADLRAARSALAALAQGSPADRRAAAALSLRMECEELAAHRRVAALQRPSLWWPEDPMGGRAEDWITPAIVAALSAVPPRRATRGAGVLGSGMALQAAMPQGQWWGAGLGAAVQGVRAVQRVLAVRGPWSRRELLAAGVDCPAVYGDTAWLMPLAYPKARPAVRYPLGLASDRPEDGQLSLPDGPVRWIDTRRIGVDALCAMVDELLACERVLVRSPTLLALCDAYGLPAWPWGEFEELTADETPEWIDYLCGAGDPLALSALENGTGMPRPALGDRASVSRRNVAVDRLLQVAPFTLRAVGGPRR